MSFTEQAQERLNEQAVVSQEFLDTVADFMTSGSTPSLMVWGVLGTIYLLCSQLTNEYMSQRNGRGILFSKFLGIVWPIAWIALGMTRTGAKVLDVWKWRRGPLPRYAYWTRDGKHLDYVDSTDVHDELWRDEWTSTKVVEVFRKGFDKYETHFQNAFKKEHDPRRVTVMPSSWDPPLPVKITGLQAGKSEHVMNGDCSLDAVSMNHIKKRPWGGGTPIALGNPPVKPAAEKDLEALDQRVTTLEGGVSHPGVIDKFEAGKIKAYRGYQGDYIEVGNHLALKGKKNGTWVEATTDHYWPDSTYEVLPGNLAYKLFREAIANNCLTEYAHLLLEPRSEDGTPTVPHV